MKYSIYFRGGELPDIHGAEFANDVQAVANAYRMMANCRWDGKPEAAEVVLLDEEQEVSTVCVSKDGMIFEFREEDE